MKAISMKKEPSLCVNLLYKICGSTDFLDLCELGRRESRLITSIRSHLLPQSGKPGKYRLNEFKFKYMSLLISFFSDSNAGPVPNESEASTPKANLHEAKLPESVPP